MLRYTSSGAMRHLPTSLRIRTACKPLFLADTCAYLVLSENYVPFISIQERSLRFPARGRLHIRNMHVLILCSEHCVPPSPFRSGNPFSSAGKSLYVPLTSKMADTVCTDSSLRSELSRVIRAIINEYRFYLRRGQAPALQLFIAMTRAGR